MVMKEKVKSRANVLSHFKNMIKTIKKLLGNIKKNDCADDEMIKMKNYLMGLRYAGL